MESSNSSNGGEKVEGLTYKEVQDLYAAVCPNWATDGRVSHMVDGIKRRLQAAEEEAKDQKAKQVHLTKELHILHRQIEQMHNGYHDSDETRKPKSHYHAFVELEDDDKKLALNEVEILRSMMEGLQGTVELYARCLAAGKNVVKALLVERLAGCTARVEKMSKAWLKNLEETTNLSELPNAMKDLFPDTKGKPMLAMTPEDAEVAMDVPDIRDNLKLNLKRLYRRCVRLARLISERLPAVLIEQERDLVIKALRQIVLTYPEFLGLRQSHFTPERVRRTRRQLAEDGMELTPVELLSDLNDAGKGLIKGMIERGNFDLAVLSPAEMLDLVRKTRRKEGES